MDVFQAWDQADNAAAGAAAPPEAFTLVGPLCSLREFGANTLVRLQCTDDERLPPTNDGPGMVGVFVPSFALPPNVGVGDMVEVSGCTVFTSATNGRTSINALQLAVVTPCRRRDDLGAQHVVDAPAGATHGPPCLLHCPGSDTGMVLVHNGAPGMRITAEVKSIVNRKNPTEPCITLELKVRQWTVQAECVPTLVPLNIRLTLWKNVCELLGFPATLMQHHSVPFYAMVRVNKSFSNAQRLSLDVLGIQWDLAVYVESPRALPVPLETVRDRFPQNAVVQAPMDGQFMVLTQEMMPEGHGWSYYVLQDCVPATLEGIDDPNRTNVFVAVYRTPAAAPAAKKRARK